VDTWQVGDIGRPLSQNTLVETRKFGGCMVTDTAEIGCCRTGRRIQEIWVCSY
jgi:hypothetical protein